MWYVWPGRIFTDIAIIQKKIHSVDNGEEHSHHDQSPHLMEDHHSDCCKRVGAVKQKSVNQTENETSVENAPLNDKDKPKSRQKIQLVKYDGYI